MNESTPATSAAVAPSRRSLASSAAALPGAGEVETFPLFQLGTIAALFIAIYWDTYAFMIDRWIHDESAQHGWLIMPIAGYVAWSKREKLKALPMRSDTRGLVVIIFAMLLHLMEKALDMNGPSPISIPIFVAGAVWYFAGTAWLRELSFPIGYLLFMVPIPGFMNQFVSFPLRLLATNGSRAIVHHLFGIEITGAGMNMEFWRPGTDHTDPVRDFVSLKVADPCSGLHSLMAIKALHAITAYLSRLKLGWKWVLFFCALPISLAANVCRMVLIILVSAYVNKDFGLHFFHDYSPYLLFIFVFLILIGVGRFMEWATGAHKRVDPTTKAVAA